MKKTTALIAVFGVLTLLIGFIVYNANDQVAEVAQPPQNTTAVAVVTQSSSRTPTSPSTKSDAYAPSDESAATLLPQDQIVSSPKSVFQVDANGNLKISEQTRLNMEALLAQTDRGDLIQAKQRAVENLPPAAAAAARDLLEHYDIYQQAQLQNYPPGHAPPTEESALAELDGLHALRVAHFGEDTAQALYGNEEKQARHFIELMRLEKDQSLTMEEKAARALQVQNKIDELAKAEHLNSERQ